MRPKEGNLVIKKLSSSDKVIALGGNPNVGKSTIFNGLTGLKQHTGNWSGKTVTNTQGYCKYNDQGYILVDLPGCYSLMAHSAEEEAARDFICFGRPDAIIIICDATCLERNLNLTLQALEITRNVIVCINLMDEAEKKKIRIDIQAISKKLGVPVIGTSARNKQGLDALMQAVSETIDHPNKNDPIKVKYPDYIENAINIMEPSVTALNQNAFKTRWLSLMLLIRDDAILEPACNDLPIKECLAPLLNELRNELSKSGITDKKIKDDIVSGLVSTAEEIGKDTIVFEDENYKERDVRIDKIFTGKRTAFPIMFLALLGIFWLTITGANYPTQLLADLLFGIEAKLLNFFTWINAPSFLGEMLVLGVYKVLAWVVSVMLPPMAIFFPLFTLLEDAGFLPRIAFNLDKFFKKCRACGKQALTMCMVCINLYCIVGDSLANYKFLNESRVQK